jgi:hypothetical protein
MVCTCHEVVHTDHPMTSKIHGRSLILHPCRGNRTLFLSTAETLDSGMMARYHKLGYAHAKVTTVHVYIVACTRAATHKRSAHRNP